MEGVNQACHQDRRARLQERPKGRREHVPNPSFYT